MRRKERKEYDEALNEVIDEVRAEHQMNGEDADEPVILSKEQVQEVMQNKYNELHDITETEEELSTTGDKIFAVIILVSLITFFVAGFAKIDDLLGFAISGFVLAPAFMSTASKGRGAFKVKRKATWKDRIGFIIIGGFLLYSSIVQAFGTEIME